MTGMSLAILRERAEGIEITNTMGDGTEIVFCGDGAEGYIGWTPRASAEENGYKVRRTERDETMLSLVEVASRALRLTEQPFGQLAPRDFYSLREALARFRP